MDQQYSSADLMTAIKDLQEATATGFSAVDQRFVDLESRMNGRFEALEYKLIKRFDSVDLRFDAFERRVVAVEQRP